MPAGLIATAAVAETVARATRTYRWPHLAIALVETSLFGLDRAGIADAGTAPARELVAELLDD